MMSQIFTRLSVAERCTPCLLAKDSQMDMHTRIHVQKHACTHFICEKIFLSMNILHPQLKHNVSSFETKTVSLYFHVSLLQIYKL